MYLRSGACAAYDYHRRCGLSILPEHQMCMPMKLSVGDGVQAVSGHAEPVAHTHDGACARCGSSSLPPHTCHAEAPHDGVHGDEPAVQCHAPGRALLPACHSCRVRRLTSPAQQALPYKPCPSQAASDCHDKSSAWRIRLLHRLAEHPTAQLGWLS